MYNHKVKPLYVDWTYRYLYKAKDFRNLLYKSIYSNNYTNISTRWRIYRQQIRTCRFSSVTKQRHRCTQTGRTHFVLWRTGLARLSFKYYASIGHISGIFRGTN